MVQLSLLLFEPLTLQPGVSMTHVHVAVESPQPVQMLFWASLSHLPQKPFSRPLSLSHKSRLAVLKVLLFVLLMMVVHAAPPPITPPASSATSRMGMFMSGATPGTKPATVVEVVVKDSLLVSVTLTDWTLVVLSVTVAWEVEVTVVVTVET